MYTIHLVSHTHWDREWYRPFQQFRLRLVHLVDGLLDLFAADPAFQFFMLDGQTIVLDDYLQMRPENEAALRQYVQDGRVLIGPWHILPDMFLVGPEAHIRNLLEGDRQARRFGPKMCIGYMPDSFGHIGQMPQILRGFGIDNASVWRGLGDQPTEFWWQSPDGSRVLMHYLRDSYSNGSAFNATVPQQFASQLQKEADLLAAHSPVPDLLVMFGTDHMEPPRETSTAIQFSNDQLKDYRVIHSTLPAYHAAVLEQIERTQCELPTVTGELRSSKRSHLLPGVLSTRMWIKQRNHACETLLEKWAEPFSTFASLAAANVGTNGGLRHPSSILREAWLMLMECHPHDSICGCSIDQVHDEMRPRFDQVEQVGEEITRQSLETLAGRVDTAGSAPRDAQSAIVVFNPSSVSRTDLVTTELSLPPGISDFEILDEAGNVVLHQSASGKPADLINVRVRREELAGLLSMVHEGRAGNLAIRRLRWRRDGAIVHVDAVFAENAEPDVSVWNSGMQALHEYLDDPGIEAFHIEARSPDSANVTFTASDVPCLGWRTFYVRPREVKPVEIKVTPLMRLLAPLARLPVAYSRLRDLVQPSHRADHRIENDLLAVKVSARDGTLTVTDKTTGMAYTGLNRFVDSGDCGDTYNFSPPTNDVTMSKPSFVSVTVMNGPVQQKMTISMVLCVPASLSDDRKSRSRQLIDLPITTTVILTHGVPRVDIHTQVENHAKDHRLRVHFPAPFAVESGDFDGHFEVVRRAVGTPPFDSTWIEQPRPEAPQRAFTSITDGKEVLTIANRGLTEAEVLQVADPTPHAEIAVTLLRCVGWLSRDDFATRNGHAGPLLATPKAQMPGEWDFDYSIILSRDANSSRRQAWNFQTLLRGVTSVIRAGSLPLEGSFVEVDHPAFVLTAVKETEARDGWIVRGYNAGDQDVPVTLKPWRKPKEAARANLAEEAIGSLAVGEDGQVRLSVKGHEIATVLFRG